MVIKVCSGTLMKRAEKRKRFAEKGNCFGLTLRFFTTHHQRHDHACRSGFIQ